MSVVKQGAATHISGKTGSNKVKEAIESLGIPVVKNAYYSKHKALYNGKLVCVDSYPFTNHCGTLAKMDFAILKDHIPVAALEIKTQNKAGSKDETLFHAVINGVKVSIFPNFLLVCVGEHWTNPKFRGQHYFQAAKEVIKDYNKEDKVHVVHLHEVRNMLVSVLEYVRK